LTEELRSAISEEHIAERKTAKAKKLAADWLQKWYDERNQRRGAQDLRTLQEKAAREYEAILQDYMSTTQDISAKCRKNGQTKMLPPIAMHLILPRYSFSIPIHLFRIIYMYSGYLF
jgi:hypothetical protein